VDLASFMTIAANGIFVWDYVATGKNTFIGSNDSMSNGWDGDDIVTGSGKDLVKARGGDDYITDKGGSDIYKGGSGWDIVTYDNWQYYAGQVKSGIKANLEKGWIEGPDGKTDKIYSIEEVRGTFLKDVFIGNSKDNAFVGLQGNDVFKGKGGFDTVSYHRDERRGGTDGVIVDLANKTARDGFGNTDTLKSIEGARGTNQDDVFIGNGKDNWFRGDDGADEFQFLGGAFGYDVIQDYDHGEGDMIVFKGGPANFAALTISQNGSDAEIDWAGNTIVLRDYDSNDLTAGDFMFI
jgi:Ca2+-binding RTX toxin-like protein